MAAGFGQSRARALRLLVLAAALTQRGWSLDELREGLELYTQARRDTGRAQFERDKQDLREAGLLLDVDDGDRYRVVGERGPGFDDDELAALNALGGAVADPDTGAALAAFAARADAYPELASRVRVLASVPDAPVLAQAVDERRAVRLRYRPASGPLADRHVEPWALRARRGLWYVLAWDRGRQGHRHFRLDRIDGVPALDGEATAPRPDVLPTDLLPGASGPVTFRLGRLGAFDARRMGATIRSGPDGSTLVDLPAVRDEAALGFALRHDAVVVTPAALDAERRLRASLVHDLHELPVPAVPDALHEDVRDRVQLDPVRLRRLLLLPSWLEARAGVTLDEVARGFGCDAEEIRVDVALLADVVLPGVGDVHEVWIEEDDTVACRSWHPAPVRLSALDRSRVRALVHAVAPLLPAHHAAGVAGLAARLDETSMSAHDPDVSPAVLGLLREAVDDARTVGFAYLSRDGRVTERSVTPTEVVVVDGRAYLVGHDHHRDGGRVFRIDRLVDLVLGRVDPVTRHVDLGVPRYVPTGDEVDVVLRSTHVGSWVFSRLLPSHRLDTDDGTVWAVVATDEPELVVDHVVVAAGEVEVVTPVWLREEIAERADRVR
jgi:predicted DNA-binding transcriptional regulator YafY